MYEFDRYTVREIENILVRIGNSKNVNLSP